MKKSYKFISDAAHGWLEVPRADLKQLQIAQDISAYSYEKGEMAYLEEDRDLSLFLKVAEQNGWEIDVDDRQYFPEWQGRNYSRFMCRITETPKGYKPPESKTFMIM